MAEIKNNICVFAFVILDVVEVEVSVVIEVEVGRGLVVPVIIIIQCELIQTCRLYHKTYSRRCTGLSMEDSFQNNPHRHNLDPGIQCNQQLYTL